MASKREPLPECVTCGSTKVQRKRVSVQLRDGRVVSGVDAEVCANCGERYYDAAAMKQLERYRSSGSNGAK